MLSVRSQTVMVLIQTIINYYLILTVKLTFNTLVTVSSIKECVPALLNLINFKH